MTLIDFIKEYPDESSCKSKYKQYSEHVGVVCPKCGNGNATGRATNASVADTVRVCEPIL